MIKLITEFKARGYHSKLRAGQSLDFLKLTRARLHIGNYEVSLKIAVTKAHHFKVYRYDHRVSQEKVGFIKVQSPFDSGEFNSWIAALTEEKIK